jgi:Ca2+-transporting ATPase
MTVTAYYDGKWQTDPKTLLSEHMAHNICLNTTASLNYQGDKPEFIGNPTECAMLAAYQNSAIYQRTGKSYKKEREDHNTLHVYPFSSDEKHMTTVSDVDGTIISYVKGSPELILSMCGLSNEEKSDINRVIEQAQNKAMRVIAFAHKTLESEIDYMDSEDHEEMESNMLFDGFVAITDPIRPEVYEAVNTCKKAGVSLKILTGDHINTARAIAEQLHILYTDSLVLNAAEIEAMSDQKLENCIDRISVIARSTPSLKLRIVQTLMKLDNIVAVTGDGVNDAPAIKYADVGIAMGIAGTEVSKEAADIVLMDDSFATISKSVRWGRGIYKNFQRFITFQLTVNLSSVITVLVSILTGFVSPFSALQLLWINIIMDGPPALTLGLEPPQNDLMREKPINRSANILTRPMLWKIAINGVWISVIFMLQTAFNFLGALDNQQSTVLFTLFVLFQLMNAFNCRELGNGSIFSNLLSNRLMLGVFAMTFALQVIITQFGGMIFGTTPLDFMLWGKMIAVSLSVIVLSELIKLVKRRKV